jgi:hypothetical protein
MLDGGKELVKMLIASLNSLEVVISVVGFLTWLAFMSACVAHAVYHFRAAARLDRLEILDRIELADRIDSPAEPVSHR